jgi:hemerythrin
MSFTDNNFDAPEGIEGQRGEPRDAAIVEWLEGLFEWGLRARYPFEMRALQALLFWAGDQWSSVESDILQRYGRKVVRPAYCEARIVDNQLPIYVRQLVSMCTDALPTFEAMPATPDEQDRKAADLATRILRVRDRVDREDELQEQELQWLAGSGECYRRTVFSARQRTVNGEQGDVDTEVVNLFRVVKAPNSGDQWPPRWLIEFDARHVDWIKAEYGKEVKPEQIADQARALDDLAMNVVSGKYPTDDGDQSMALLKRMYAAPSERYPQGHVFVWAGKTLLKEHDFQADAFPFSRSIWYPIPGRLYAMSFLEPLLSDQRQLNTVLSQLREVQNRQLRGDILHNGPNDITERLVSEETGQKEIRLPPGTDRWEFIRYDLNLSTAMADMERLMRGLHDKAGQAEPTVGQMAARDSTATELQLMREAGYQNIAWHMRNFERHIRSVYAQKLLLIREFVNQSRVLADTGNASAKSLEYFWGAELRNTRDVISVPTPRLTPALRRELQTEAAKAGLYTEFRGPDDLPNPFAQYRARTALRKMGLVDEEEQIAQAFGAYEDLEEHVAELQKIGERMFEMRAALMVQKMLGEFMPQQPPAPPAMPAMPPEMMQGAPPAQMPPQMPPDAQPPPDVMMGVTPTDGIVY